MQHHEWYTGGPWMILAYINRQPNSSICVFSRKFHANPSHHDKQSGNWRWRRMCMNHEVRGSPVAETRRVNKHLIKHEVVRKTYVNYSFTTIFYSLNINFALIFYPSFRSDLCSETEICESLWFDSLHVCTNHFSSRTRVMVEELGYVSSNILDSVAKVDALLVCRYRSWPN